MLYRTILGYGPEEEPTLKEVEDRLLSEHGIKSVYKRVDNTIIRSAGNVFRICDEE